MGAIDPQVSQNEDFGPLRIRILDRGGAMDLCRADAD